jgi:alpha-N-arabinofuranosidase
MEYCNYPGGTTLSDARIANGATDPFNVRYWGVGNENWGCGGNMLPEEYAKEYRRYSTYLAGRWPFDPYLIACGPRSNDLDWTERFFDKYKGCSCKSGPEVLRMHGYAAHHYSWSKDTANSFDEEGWNRLLGDAFEVEELLVQQRALMDRYDPERRISLILDEWGAWHKPTPDTTELWQQNTVRDALLAAITLDAMNRQADKVSMANIAQTVNVLQALLLTHEDSLVKTPTYHVFDLYRSHREGTSLRTVFDTDGVSESLPHVSGSASLKGDRLTVTLTNLSMKNPKDVTLNLHGAGITEVVDRCFLSYTDGDVRCHNTVSDPDAVSLQHCSPVPVNAGGVCLNLEPASVVRIVARLNR